MDDKKPDIGILQSHKNGFLERIKSHKRKRSEITAEERLFEGRWAFVIELKETPFVFAIARAPHSFDTFYCKATRLEPGFSTGEWELAVSSDIKSIYERFDNWLTGEAGRYLHEMSLPDKWA